MTGAAEAVRHHAHTASCETSDPEMRRGIVHLPLARQSAPGGEFAFMAAPRALPEGGRENGHGGECPHTLF